jgi:hypothetical protein
MLRLSLGALTLVALTALLAPALDDKAADVPFQGRWKITFVRGDHAISFCVVRLDGSAAKPRGKAVAVLPKYEGAKVRDLKVEAGAVRFNVASEDGTMGVVAYPPKGEDKPKMLYATVQGPKELYLARLEPSDQDELKERDDVTVEEGFDQFIKLTGKDFDEKTKILRSIVENYAGKPAAVEAGRQLAGRLARDPDASEADVQAAVKALLESTQPYGRELEVQTSQLVARDLLNTTKGLPAAVELAQRAEKLLTDADPPVRVGAVLQTLILALRKADKADEARAFIPKLAKINSALDAEFEKTAIPFQPGTFPGRKGKGRHIPVVELFTGAQCPPCVAADVAFDAALKTYDVKDVVLLQYHLHIPGPDPLTNAETVARAKYYGDDVQGTPSALVDGKKIASLGGQRADGEASYNALRKLLDEAVERDAGAELKLDVKRRGDRLDVKAEAFAAKKDAKLRLKLALVEETSRYLGNNGQRVHRCVVRTFPAGAEGLGLNDGSAVQNVRIELGEVRKTLGEYLTAQNKEFEGYFAPEDMQQELKDLRIVAFVQDEESRRILEALQVKVAGE